MDRLSQLRGGAGGSRDSLDSSAPGDSFLTANDTPSKYYSLPEDDSSFDITKDISLEPSTSRPTLNDSDCFSNLSPIGKKDLFGKQIEAANILSGGVNIFDDNDNSCDDNELVIDDNVEGDNSSSLKSPENPALPARGDNVEVDKSPSLQLPESSTPLQGDTAVAKDQSSSVNTPGSSGLPLQNDNVEISENPPSVESQESSEVPLQDENIETVENPPSIESLVSLESQESSDPPLDPGNEQGENGNVLLDQDACLPVQNGDLPLEQAAEIRHLPMQDGELVENGNHALDNEDQANNLAENRAEVVLQIDGTNVDAINIGTGLYLYRREGQDELAAVQIIDEEEPSFKFLKVRENDEGNLEVYEEIQEVIVVSQGAPVREERQVAPTPCTSRETNKPVNEPSTSKKVENKDNTPDKDAPVPSTSKQKIEPNKDAQAESKPGLNLNGKMVKFNESRKSPLMAYHSTPNKEGIPLTKTMVDQQLHPNRHSDNIKKTIEVHTDHCKQRILDMPSTSKDYVIPEKVSNDAHQKEQPMVTENPEKKHISIANKQVPEVVEKETDEVAGNSNDVATEKEQVEKLNEKAEEEKPNEKEVERPNEKVEVEKTSEKIEVKKPSDKVEVGKPSEKVVVEKSSDKVEVEKPNEKVGVEKPSAKVEVEKPCEKVDEIKPLVINKTKEPTDTFPIVSGQETGKTVSVEKLETQNKIPHSSGRIEIERVNKEHKTGIIKDVTQNERPTTSYSSTTSLPTTTLGDTPMEIDNQEVKVPKNEEPKENLVVVSTEMESDDMEIDEDALVIEDQIVEGLRDNEPNKQEVESLEPPVEIQSKSKTEGLIIEDKETKTQHLETGNVKPATSAETKVSFGEKLDSSKPSNTDYPTNVKNIDDIKKDGLIIIDNRSENELKARDSLSKKEVEGTKSKDTQLSSGIKILENRVIKEPTPPKEKDTPDINKIEHNKVKEWKSTVSTAKSNLVNSSYINKILEKKFEVPIKDNKDVKTPSLFPIKEPQSCLPINTQSIVKPIVINKVDIKTAAINPAETKKEVNHKPILNAVDTKSKSINNNHAPVPFGKWTEANRQDFLNKIKESNTKPVSVPNTNQIKQPNDLNRRDVLKKIDSQRQTYNANVKIQESLQKGNVKPETAFASKTAPATVTKREIKAPLKPEALIVKPKPILNKKPAQAPQQQLPPEPTAPAATVSSTSKKETQRKEINNQDLIDKTIEGIINRAVTGKNSDDVKQAVVETPTIEKHDKKPEQKPNSEPTLLDAIEMKMNELHGIPFVERPPHELPRPYVTESKAPPTTETHNIPPKVSKIPNLLPLTKTQQKLKDCEDDIINLEIPRDKPATPTLLSSKPIEKSLTKPAQDTSKDKIITEKEFDRFARRNSVTYEHCLTVTDSHQVIQTVVPREAPPKKISRNEQMLAEAKAKSPHKHLPVKQYHPSKAAAKYMPVSDQNKHYQSKLQLAYQTAITAKRRMDSPITIIEDKPVKVVYLDSNLSEFKAGQLNVQGRDLSPAKRLPEPDAITVGTGDSLDSDILDAMDTVRSNNQDEAKIKSKHQRKQVLTPVETPDLELIEPGDLGIEVSPRKKRKVDDRPDRISKNLVPKKSYLLGRNMPPAEPTEPIVPKETHANPAPAVVHNDAVSAIDNLVKAAELLDNQSESMNASSASVQSVDSPQGTPVKRGRGRPRKNPLPESTDVKGHASPPKKPKLIDAKPTKHISSSEEDSSDDDSMIKENWTMGKINEKIVCPICNKLFRSENVVFKHVKHCTGPSPSRSDSDKRSPRRSRLSRESKSRDSESKSRGSRHDDDEVDLSPARSVRKTPFKRKSKDSGKSSSSDDVIPVETDPKESDDNDVPKKHESRKSIKPKNNPRTSNLVCEICGKSFRQLSYLVSHKLQHKKEENKRPGNEPHTTEKSVFSCETCKKEFRKLHHLVQHRLIHNPVPSRALRKTSSEQKELPKSQDASKVEDQSAGFRCEPCDKSFRKLHHLVEHRETHDGINRQRSNSVTQATPEKEKPSPPPQCDVCKKTFRKLHHLIEHKEQHLETSSEKSDDQKSVKSSLSTKDIIHECNLCYMVFPNEHSLTKHSVICLRKKKQSAAKRAASQEDKGAEDAAKVEPPEESKAESAVPQPAEAKDVEEKVEKLPEKPVEPPPQVELPETKIEPPKPETLPTVNKIDKPVNEPKPVAVKKAPSTEKSVPKVVKPDPPAKIKQVDEIIVIEDTPKKKVPSKDKVAPTVTRRPKICTSTPLEPPPEPVQPSSDEDEVRYMLNPHFKEDAVKIEFMKVRAKKCSSLNVEHPNSEDLVSRRSLLQHPPKIPRHRAKSDDVTVPQKPAVKSKVEIVEVPSTDSDDSDVKYSFPKTVPDKPAQPEKREPEIEKKRRKTMAEKRKSLTGIAKRKSLGAANVKAAAKPSPAKPIKRRTMAAEHRCDCGQLFSSAALLARHASLAHTPPRLRRRREPAAGPKAAANPKLSPNPSHKAATNPKLTPNPNPKAATNPKLTPNPSHKAATKLTPNPNPKLTPNPNPKTATKRKTSARSDASGEKLTRKATTSAKEAPETLKKTVKSRNRVHVGIPFPEKRGTRK